MTGLVIGMTIGMPCQKCYRYVVSRKDCQNKAFPSPLLRELKYKTKNTSCQSYLCIDPTG